MGKSDDKDWYCYDDDDDDDDHDDDDDARGGGEGGSGHTGWLKVSRRSLYSVLTDHHHWSWLLGDHHYLFLIITIWLLGDSHTLSLGDPCSDYRQHCLDHYHLWVIITIPVLVKRLTCWIHYLIITIFRDHHHRWSLPILGFIWWWMSFLFCLYFPGSLLRFFLHHRIVECHFFWYLGHSGYDHKHQLSLTFSQQTCPRWASSSASWIMILSAKKISMWNICRSDLFWPNGT